MSEDGQDERTMLRSDLVANVRESWEVVREASFANHGRGTLIPEYARGLMAQEVLKFYLSFEVYDDRNLPADQPTQEVSQVDGDGEP